MTGDDWKLLVEAAGLQGAVSKLAEYAVFEDCLTALNGTRLVRLSLPEDHAILKTAVLIDRLADKVSAVAPYTVAIEMSIKKKQKTIRLPEHRSTQ